MQILQYNDLDVSRVSAAFQRTVDALKAGDFRSADVKKLKEEEMEMKNFLELARTRCSIRSYRPDPISDEQLAPLLEAARLAPSATNAQPLQLVVVRRRERLDALAEAYPGDWFREAPAVIAICTLPAKAWKRARHDNRSYADVDAAIAADHITLAAADSELGTCWIAAFDPAGVRTALQLPRTVEPLILLTLGKPAEEGRPKTRKPLDKLVRYESWKNE